MSWVPLVGSGFSYTADLAAGVAFVGNNLEVSGLDMSTIDSGPDPASITFPDGSDVPVQIRITVLSYSQTNPGIGIDYNPMHICIRGHLESITDAGATNTTAPAPATTWAGDDVEAFAPSSFTVTPPGDGHHFDLSFENGATSPDSTLVSFSILIEVGDPGACVWEDPVGATEDCIP